MVKVNAPALSLDASGSLGGSMVFSKWKGRNYVRSLVRPSNPQSDGQTGVRAVFKFLSQQWASISAPNQATWDDLADAAATSAFNQYMKENLRRFRSFLGIGQSYPAGNTGTPTVFGNAITAAGERSITMEIPVTTQNDGWALFIFRALTTAFTPAWDNLIAVVPITADGTTITYIDSPLDPDEYFYNFYQCTNDHLFSSHDDEVSATVT